jgi:hypothetical protein
MCFSASSHSGLGQSVLIFHPSRAPARIVDGHAETK